MTLLPSNCTESIIEFARDVAPKLRAGTVPLISLEQERWQRGNDGAARPVTIEQTIARDGGETISPSLYESARQAIRDDPDFGPVVGGQLGSSMGTSSFDESTVLRAVLQALVARLPAEKPDQIVTEEVAAVRSFVTATERQWIMLIPLPWLKSLSWPVNLEPGLQIDRFTDDEVNDCARVGVLRPMSPSLRLLTAEECVGVRAEFRLPSVAFGPGSTQPAGSQTRPNDPHRFGERHPLRCSELLEDVLFALRLSRADPIGTTGATLVQHSLVGDSYQSVTRASRATWRDWLSHR